MEANLAAILNETVRLILIFALPMAAVSLGATALCAIFQRLIKVEDSELYTIFRMIFLLILGIATASILTSQFVGFTVTLWRSN